MKMKLSVALVLSTLLASPVFAGLDEAVQAFPLTCCEILNYLTLTFFDNNVDPVVGFFVVTGRGFLLCV